MAANFIEQRLFCLDDLQHLHGVSRATTAQPRAISIPWVCGEVRAFRGSVFGGGGRGALVEVGARIIWN